MFRKHTGAVILSGLCAGAINGLFGGAGGMVLVPLLTALTDLEDDEIFPASISIMLPICLVSLAYRSLTAPLPLSAAAPYLIGGALGGITAGLWGQAIPTRWLHKGLGILILWGGIRYLC